MKVNSLDNIPDSVLDRLVELYSDYEQIRVNDERRMETDPQRFKPSPYFLIAKDFSTEVKWKFVWIENNLWQFQYINSSYEAKWKDPINLLNEILNPHESQSKTI